MTSLVVHFCSAPLVCFVDALDTREHPECRRTFQVGWNEMVRLAAQAAGFPTIQQVQNTST